MTKRQLEEIIRKEVRRNLKEETVIDYRYIDSAAAAVNDAHDIIQKFNDTVKTTSTHSNVQSIKEKMFKLEEFLDKYETQLAKIRNKF